MLATHFVWVIAVAAHYKRSIDSSIMSKNAINANTQPLERINHED